MEKESRDGLFLWITADKADHRSANWLFIRSPWQPLLVVLAYLYVVMKGPGWMEHRKALGIKYVMIVYNLAMVALNFWIAKRIFISSFLRPDFSLLCEPVDYSDDPQSFELASALWWYYISKFIELLDTASDTMFFIVRKKNSQVSFLHVYHHTAMPLLWWMTVRYYPGGSANFSTFANSVIHVIMYTYYLLASVGPSMHRFLWWKKYMTSLQLLQFAVVTTHSLAAVYLDCGFPRCCMLLQAAFLTSLALLFSNFYQKAYGRARAKTPLHNIQNGGILKSETESKETENAGHDSQSTIQNGGIMKTESKDTEKAYRRARTKMPQPAHSQSTIQNGGILKTETKSRETANGHARTLESDSNVHLQNGHAKLS